ncbi:flagellar biosynthetic protein FliO [Microbacterium sp. NPDC056044]|uniref:flagellar biosynthetic protein FliO n=1 Tax=Microbacterium sp. NPDC056044 TaxID=3345690 RepID=UPI0035DFDE8A
MLGLFWYLHRRVSKRGTARKDTETITVLGRQGLGAKAQLVVVQTEDARYVLAVSERGVEVVDKLPARTATDASHPAPSKAGGTGSFEQVLTTASGTGLEHPYPLRSRRRHDPLQGSILSAETWRQTAEALRRAR